MSSEQVNLLLMKYYLVFAFLRYMIIMLLNGKRSRNGLIESCPNTDVEPRILDNLPIAVRYLMIVKQ